MLAAKNKDDTAKVSPFNRGFSSMWETTPHSQTKKGAQLDGII